MFNLFLTILIPLLVICLFLLKFGVGPYSNSFSKDYTNAIKGLCAIIVIYVHMPQEYSNPLQDMIGSFAYVAVTFFFLVSAYGMQISATKSSNYLHNFWRNRIVALLVPMAAVNMFRFIFLALAVDIFKFDYLYNINMYVVILLGYCLWFWIVKFLQRQYGFKDMIADCILIGGILVSSLSLYLFSYNTVSANSGWCFEQFGLIWGILLSKYKTQLFGFLTKFSWSNRIIISLFALILGIGYLKFKTVYFIGEYVLKIVLGATILLTVFVWTDTLNISNRYTKYLGNISYEVYLLHGFFLMTIGPLFFGFFSSGAYILSVIILTIISGAIVHLFDKPIVKMLRK